jgi:peptidoglycan/LPS O-acetylase OafA/YrhL
MKPARLLELDILRAVAIALVVFSHFPAISTLYIDPSIKFWTAIIGLSLFIFISGFLLYRNNNLIKNRSDLVKFYKKRLIRIYPLYVLIVGVYVFIQYAIPHVAQTLNIYLSPTEIVLNVVGLQGTLNIPAYGVLWFIGVLLAYYFIYPIMIWATSGNTGRILIFSFTTLAIFSAANTAIGFIMPQMIYYFPVFIAGVLVSKAFMAAKPRLRPNKYIMPVLIISAISYAIYLTHMLILTACVLPQVSAVQTDWFLVFVGIPMIVVVSYILTRADNRLARWMR